VNKERRKRIEAAIKSVAGLEELIQGLTTALTGIDALDPERWIDGCSYDAVKGLVRNMGRRARSALAGDTP
jgi:hypothetical protein